MMQTEGLLFRKSILKLKETEVFKVLSRWSFLGDEDVEQLRLEIDTTQTKQKIANTILEYCESKGGFNLETVGELELLYLQLHTVKRQWSAYQLSGKHGKVPADISSPAKFKQKLSKLIRLYFHKDCSTSILLHDGLLWARVYLPRPGTRVFQPSRCLYFVHYPDTPIVIFSGMRAGLADFLTHCLVVALGYQEATEMCLSGHHIESIAELAINKFSQGGFNKFQKTHRPNGPLSVTRTRKRKVPDTPLDSSIVDENRAEKKQRLEDLTDSFGEFEQPILEKLEYKVELPYRSKTVAPDLRSEGQIFTSRVKFTGKNVLEGLRNLAQGGYASVPLPKYLTCVPARARNYFLLTKPQKKNDNVQNENKSVSPDTSSKRKEISSPRDARATKRHVLSEGSNTSSPR